jgi:electron transport complex protein RnfC
VSLVPIINRRTERLRSFPHGVHPPEFKNSTRDLPIERIPFVNEYVLPLSQHTGAPAEPVVRPGDRVRRGQVIAQPKGFVSTALHAPVTGTVQAIELRAHPNGKLLPAIVLRADPFAFEPADRVERDHLAAAILAVTLTEERADPGEVP